MFVHACMHLCIQQCVCWSLYWTLVFFTPSTFSRSFCSSRKISLVFLFLLLTQRSLLPFCSQPHKFHLRGVFFVSQSSAVYKAIIRWLQFLFYLLRKFEFSQCVFVRSFTPPSVFTKPVENRLMSIIFVQLVLLYMITSDSLLIALLAIWIVFCCYSSLFSRPNAVFLLI